MGLNATFVDIQAVLEEPLKRTVRSRRSQQYLNFPSERGETLLFFEAWLSRVGVDPPPTPRSTRPPSISGVTGVTITPAYPGKHKALTQCRIKVGPASVMLAQHRPNIGSRV